MEEQKILDGIVAIQKKLERLDTIEKELKRLDTLEKNLNEVKEIALGNQRQIIQTNSSVNNAFTHTQTRLDRIDANLRVLVQETHDNKVDIVQLKASK